jgi:hypothetical protein
MSVRGTIVLDPSALTRRVSLRCDDIVAAQVFTFSTPEASYHWPIEVLRGLHVAMEGAASTLSKPIRPLITWLLDRCFSASRFLKVAHRIPDARSAFAEDDSQEHNCIVIQSREGCGKISQHCSATSLPRD